MKLLMPDVFTVFSNKDDDDEDDGALFGPFLSPLEFSF